MDKRRNTRPKRRAASAYRKKQRQKISVNEILIIQTGICGVILLFFLIAGLFNIPVANSFRDSFKSLITEDVSESGTDSTLAGMGNGVKNYVLDLLGFYDENSAYPDSEGIQSVFSTSSEGLGDDLRIDEDMLKQIYSIEDIIEENNVKKPEVPLN